MQLLTWLLQRLVCQEDCCHCSAVVCSCLCPTSISEAPAALQNPFAKLLQGQSELCPGRKEPLALGPLPVAPLGRVQHEWCLLAGIPPCTAVCLVLVPKRNKQHMTVSETNWPPRCQGRSKGSGNLSFTWLQLILGFAGAKPGSVQLLISCCGARFPLPWNREVGTNLGKSTVLFLGKQHGVGKC